MKEEYDFTKGKWTTIEGVFFRKLFLTPSVKKIFIVDELIIGRITAIMDVLLQSIRVL